MTLSRSKLFVTFLLVLACVALLVPTRAVTATGFANPVYEGARACPLYEACMQFEGGGCSCTGFVCNGHFVCGVPIT